MIKKELLTGSFISLLVLLTAWLWISPTGITFAPEIAFKTIDGRQINLRELRGHPVIVTFWATTCPGCMKEIPHLVSLYNELSGDGLEIIGVAMSYDPPNQVVEFTNSRKLPYPISLDVDGSIASAFDNVILTPTSFLIAPDGKILNRKIGEMDMDKTRQQILNILSQQAQVNTNKSGNEINKS